LTNKTGKDGSRLVESLTILALVMWGTK